MTVPNSEMTGRSACYIGRNAEMTGRTGRREISEHGDDWSELRADRTELGDDWTEVSGEW
jgi:hypothetical protein